MRYRKTITSILIYSMLFAFSTHVYAMEFDAEEYYRSIFVIYSGRNIGSGFAIGSNTVVTNAHVLENLSDISVYSYEGDVYSAMVYLIDDNFDIAILSVENADFDALPVGDSATVKAGEDIYAIGAPKSLSYTLTKGIISSKSRTIGRYDYIQIDAAINSGNSGGPLLNAKGEVIGVNSMKMADAEGIGWAIPINAVINFIESNGVETNESNNVTGELPFARHPYRGEKKSDTKAEYQPIEDHLRITVIILSTALVVSVVFNVGLIICLVDLSKKKKQIDRRERTDFEIDIL